MSRLPTASRSTTIASDKRHLYVSIALAVCVADNATVLLWGPPGNGKTSVISNIARAYNLHLEVVLASIREPADFAGYPYIDNGKSSTIVPNADLATQDRMSQKVMHLAPPAWAHRLADAYESHKQIGIAFYDEITTASPETQAALLRPVLEKQVGDLFLPKGTRSLGAANPPDIAANGWDISPPVANRFVHLDWVLDAATVKRGFTHGWEDAPIPNLPSGKAKRLARRQSLALVGTFIGTRPELVTVIPKDFGIPKGDFAASDYAFPTPRSWETAAFLHAACTHGTLPNGDPIPSGVLDILLRGVIGKAATVEFLRFLRALDLPDATDLIDGKIEFVMPERADQVEAILSGLEYVYAREPSDHRWSVMGDILSALTENSWADAAYVYTKNWYTNRPRNMVPTGQHVKSLSRILDELES
jgi:AAA domain (dynein-related subfamily)